MCVFLICAFLLMSVSTKDKLSQSRAEEVRGGQKLTSYFLLIVLWVHMAELYNPMILISRHVQLLSDAVHLLSIFTRSIMLSQMRDSEEENP